VASPDLDLRRRDALFEMTGPYGAEVPALAGGPAAEATQAMAPLLGWSVERMQAEVDQRHRRRAADMAFPSPMPRLDPAE
jgi:hypothetical protein